MQLIQIQIIDMYNAREINSPSAGRRFRIQEIEIGSPST